MGLLIDLLGDANATSVADHVAATDPHGDRAFARRRDPFSQIGVNPLPSMWLASASVALSSGSLQGMYFYADTSDSVTDLACVITTAAGATPTLSRLGVWTADPATGHLLALAASTTNDTALLTSTGTRSSAISGGTQVTGGAWTPVVGQFYMAGVLCVTAASDPTFVTNANLGSAFVSNISFAGSPNPMTFSVTGQTDLPASVSSGINNNMTRTPLVVGLF